MNAGLLKSTRRWLLSLLVAAVLAASAGYAPVLLDELAGTSIVPATYACQSQGGGCCC